MTIETVLEARFVIGESATWVEDESALYWIDVKSPALYRLHPSDGTTRRWEMNSDIGAFALTGDGAAVVALRRGIYRLNLDSGALQRLAPPPFDPALFRFNEGACDERGRFWIGVMFDPQPGSASKRPGKLHSFTLDGGLREENDDAELHNGMAWSADGCTFFISHSYTGEIVAYDYDFVDGTLANRRVFARVPAADGIPDGAAVDSEGGYWCALHGGGRLRRFHPNGVVDQDIGLPVTQPTMPAFAGDDLTTIYLTSASDNMSEEELASEIAAGALLRLTIGKRGIRRHCIVR